MDQKISAVIITLNEERNIARCIKSLEGVVDEIVVIDSFSTDRTPEICLGFGVVFHQQKWLGYSAQKNLGNEKASHNYILSIDADEALSDNLGAEIRLLKNQLNSYSAYKMNRLTNYCGKWVYNSGWYPDAKFRLFDKREYKWQGAIHESLSPQPDRFKLLKGDLLHFSFHTIMQHQEKIAQYSELMAQKKHRNGQKSNIWLIVFAPVVAFLSTYILKQGFMDGMAGFIIAKTKAWQTFLKYLRLKELNEKKQHPFEK